ncbi:endonuclease/exonuclease/phosphatase family protein [Streptomyces albipurpureus]|uniref:Endonuclease/exonuclease/phosphatase family protein n=1 Tax=Streptomyces albipurpureus TaxID=2897419 RepID=A0ABT0UMQ5_9ACTN|nr:endonuclease/exonuclease/phosphatase family protein [Streptomyces sp. CWNU-1]MCM2389511.1 endonuclease/exonuclease/phosphatase family protein [Streptomyces sp. CWNU-1]
MSAPAGIGRPAAEPEPGPNPLSAPPAEPPRTRAAHAAATALFALAALWVLNTLLRTAFSGRWWLWNGIDLAPPLAYLVVPLVLLLPAVLLRRLRRPNLLLVVLALLLGAGQAGVHPGALLRDRPPVPADALRVVSWNTFFWHQDTDPRRFYTYLRGYEADVYLLQEYQNARGDRPAPIDDLARIRAAFPGYRIATEGGFITLSRHPITLTRALRPTGLPAPDTDWPDYWDIRALRTDVSVGGRTLSLYNTHLPDLLNVDRNPLTPAYYHAVGEHAHRRLLHLRELRADLDANSHPVVLGGDLNVLPGSADLRWFRGLRDTAESGTDPYPATFPAGPAAMWRLDWTFASPSIDIHRQSLDDPPPGLSTHRLIQLRLSLPPLPSTRADGSRPAEEPKVQS